MGCTVIMKLAQIKHLHGCHQTSLSQINSLNVNNEVIYISDNTNQLSTRHRLLHWIYVNLFLFFFLEIQI